MKSDLISEQDAAHLIEHREYIIAGALINHNGELIPADDDAARHLSGAAIAADIREYLDVVHEKMDAGDLAGAAHVAKLRDGALQLEAFHLQQLDTAAH